MPWVGDEHRHAGARSRRSHRARARCGGIGFGGEPTDEVSVHRRSEHKGNVGSKPGKLTMAATNRGGRASMRRRKWWVRRRFSMVEDQRWAMVSRRGPAIRGSEGGG
jgi:hypothetical protein